MQSSHKHFNIEIYKKHKGHTQSKIRKSYSKYLITLSKLVLFRKTANTSGTSNPDRKTIQDLIALEHWSNTWGMKFNINKILLYHANQ